MADPVDDDTEMPDAEAATFELNERLGRVGFTPISDPNRHIDVV